MFCFVCVIGLIYREIKSDNIGILDENRNIFLCYRNLENTNRIQSHLLVMVYVGWKWANQRMIDWLMDLCFFFFFFISQISPDFIFL
jgi:hypothetical protein